MNNKRISLLLILNATIMVSVILLVIFISRPVLASENKNDDEIKITFFKVHNDFAQTDTFKAKETIIFYILWNIPKSVKLKGGAVLTIEGKSVNDKSWRIKERKELSYKFPSHFWGWDCFKKIPKNAKPGSVGTATVELSIKGHDTVKKVLTFNIEKS